MASNLVDFLQVLDDAIEGRTRPLRSAGARLGLRLIDGIGAVVAPLVVVGAAVVRGLAANANALLFAVGFAAFESGLAWWAGRPMASMVGGAILMIVAVWPFVRPMRKG